MKTKTTSNKNNNNNKPKPPKDELLLTVRLPRNGAKGYIFNFYKDGKQVGWHHAHKREFVSVDNVVYGFLSCSGNIPIENSILFDKASVVEDCKCCCHK